MSPSNYIMRQKWQRKWNQANWSLCSLRCACQITMQSLVINKNSCSVDRDVVVWPNVAERSCSCLVPLEAKTCMKKDVTTGNEVCLAAPLEPGAKVGQTLSRMRSFLVSFHHLTSLSNPWAQFMFSFSPPSWGASTVNYSGWWRAVPGAFAHD